MIGHVIDGYERTFVRVLALAAVLGAVGVVAAYCLGCVSAIDVGRRTLEQTATVAALLDHELAEARRHTSLEVRARPDATLEEHQLAMAPFDEALIVTQDLHGAMLATETALNAAAAGQAGDWMGLGACVLAAFSALVAIAARQVDVPDDVGDVLLLLGGLAAGACPLPVRASADGGAP